MQERIEQLNAEVQNLTTIVSSLKAQSVDKEKLLDRANLDVKRKEDQMQKMLKQFKEKEARKQQIQEEYKKIIDELKTQKY